MKELINLSINPTYWCNFRCHFCYLTKEQLSDQKTLDLKKLKKLLEEVSEYRQIDMVDLYGGEVGLLPLDYLKQLKSLVYTYSPQTEFNIITNLSDVHPFFLEPDIILAVSFDYDCRQSYKKVLQNMLSIPKDIHILMLASPKMMEWSDETLKQVIRLFNMTGNIKTVEIKPYSSNQANQFLNTNKKFEEFVIRWLKHKNTFKFSFGNEDLIQSCIKAEKNSYSDDHLYVTPNGKWGVLDFDKQGHEYFQELDSYEDYINWCDKEKTVMTQNFLCQNCEYQGHCLSEHLRNIKDDSDSCSGFKGLLDWYKNNQDSGVISPSPNL